MKQQPQASFSHHPFLLQGRDHPTSPLNSTRLNLFPCRRHPNSKSLQRSLHPKRPFLCCRTKKRLGSPELKSRNSNSLLGLRHSSFVCSQQQQRKDTLFLGQPSPALVSKRLFEPRTHTQVPIKGFPELPQRRGLGISTDEIAVPKQTRRRGVADRMKQTGPETPLCQTRMRR